MAIYGATATLVGSKVTVTPDNLGDAKQVLVANHHASNNYTLHVPAAQATGMCTVRANSFLILPVDDPADIGINGTGDYTVLYSDKTGVLQADRYSTQTIAAGTVTTAMLEADAIDGTRLADDACDSEHYTNGSVDLVHLAAASLDGTIAKVVADDNVIGGVPVVHRIDIADGAGDTDVTLTHKTRVIRVDVVKTAANGGAGDTVTIKNGSNAITDAIDLQINDKEFTGAGEIDDAQHEIAASGTLKVTAANATNNACTVYVYGLRVA